MTSLVCKNSKNANPFTARELMLMSGICGSFWNLNNRENMSYHLWAINVLTNDFKDAGVSVPTVLVRLRVEHDLFRQRLQVLELICKELYKNNEARIISDEDVETRESAIFKEEGCRYEELYALWVRLDKEISAMKYNS